MTVGGVVVGLAAATGVAQAAGGTDSSSDTTIYACVSNKDGGVRIVSATTTCGKAESPMTWDRTGPVGATGPAGSDGTPGAPGAPGPAGAPAPDPTPHSEVVGTVTVTPQQGPAVSFPVYGYSTGATAVAAPIGSSSGGSGAGKVSLDPVTLTKAVDSSSPSLFGWVTTGKPLSEVVVKLGDPTDPTYPTETVKLTHALVASVQPADDGSADAKLLEGVSFDAVTVSVTVGDNTSTWDQDTNTTQ